MFIFHIYISLLWWHISANAKPIENLVQRYNTRAHHFKKHTSILGNAVPAVSNVVRAVWKCFVFFEMVCACFVMLCQFFFWFCVCTNMPPYSTVSIVLQVGAYAQVFLIFHYAVLVTPHRVYMHVQGRDPSQSSCTLHARRRRKVTKKWLRHALNLLLLPVIPFSFIVGHVWTIFVT